MAEVDDDNDGVGGRGEDDEAPASAERSRVTRWTVRIARGVAGARARREAIRSGKGAAASSVGERRADRAEWKEWGEERVRVDDGT